MEYVPMKVIYVAGPFRAPSTWLIEQNIRKAEEAALNIWRAGAVALSPHLNTRFFQGAAPDEVWLQGDLELMKRCDAVLMLEGWKESAGSTIEHQYAMKWGLKVLYSHDEAVRWIHGNGKQSVRAEGDDENVRKWSDPEH